MIKLIASDYDGTINCGGDSISNNAKAVNAWRKTGRYFGIVTGRGAGIVDEVGKNNIGTDFVLCNNGSVCFMNGELVYAKRNEVSIVSDMVDFVIGLGAGLFNVCCPEYETGFKGREVIELSQSMLGFTQLSVLCANNDDASRISDEINKKYDGVLVSYPNGQFIDTVRFGTSKATGILEAAKFIGVNNTEITAVGDNLNDLVMIDAFDGYAVQSGREEVKKRAKHVTESVADMIYSLLE